MSRILLVDDDKDLLDIARSFLKKENPNFQLISTTSASDAIQKLTTGQIEAVISDYKMPGMDGLELLKQLRQAGNNVPFIIFTGKGREEVAMQALNLGADYYLMKGGDPGSLYGELAHIITRVLEHRHTEAALQQSEELFSKAFRSSPQGILISRVSDGLVLEINATCEKATGYHRDELIGNTASDLNIVRLEDRTQIRRILEKQRFYRDYEGVFYTKSGEERNGLFSGEIVNINEELCLVSVINDITNQKQAEKARRQAEEKYKALFDKIPIGIGTVTPDGQITSANPFMLQLIGYSFNELKNLNSISLYVNPRDPIWLRNTLQEWGFVRNWDVELKRKDGTIFQAMINVDFIEIEEQKTFLITIDDVTLRAIAENELRRNESRFRKVVENIQEGLAIIENREVVFANNRLNEITGYSKEELRKITAPDLAAPEERERIKQIFQNYKAGKPLKAPLKFWIQRKNGSQRLVHYRYAHPEGFKAGGEFISWYLFVSDVTEQKLADEQLKESEQRFREIFRAIPDPAYLYQRMSDDRIVLLEVNKAALEISQGLLAFCVNHDLDSLVSSDTFSPLLKCHGVALWEVAVNVRGVLESGKALQMEKNFTGHSGEDLFFLLSYVPTSSNSVLLISNDLTERQRRAEELNEFAQSMMHDLKTPLLSIEGYADLLQGDYDEDAAKTIGRLAQRIQRILRRSAELAEAGRIIEASSQVDLTHIVREVTDSTIPKHITVHLDELPTVQGDRLKLVQVFQNLLENAILHGEPQTIEIRRGESKKTNQVLVTNDGKPIPAEHRDRLFQRGFTTKNRGGGLGLAIVQKLVEAHGWEIQLDASQTTTFRIIIPK